MKSLTPEQCNQLAGKLASQVRGEVSGDVLTRALYSTDASMYQIMPSLVVTPSSADDVSAAVAFGSKEGLSIGPRGGGTGLAGECLSNGIVLDFTKNMNRILTVDVDNNLAVVQPGCVFQQLNDRLGPIRKIFGPDPASGNRCTLGGMLGNNSTGAHSIVYGHTAKYVHWLDTVLSDGSRAKFYDDGRVVGDSPLARRIQSEIPPLLEQWQDRIAKHWPPAPRNRAGYGVKDAWRDGKVNWTKLLCGSEGSLAVFVEAELGLLNAPKFKCQIQANFVTLDAMAESLAQIVAAGATTVELMDNVVMCLARDAYPESADLLPDVEASLTIEVDGNTEEQFEGKIAGILAVIEARPGLANKPIAIRDPARQNELLTVRKKAVPLLSRGRDVAKAIQVIDDVTVAVDKMPAYLRGLAAIAADEKVTLAYYAHAGDGELHIQPYLNLYETSERQRMQRITRRTFELAWSLGGSVSGEHGCGLVRSGFLARQYGPIYDLFRQIKRIFDPNNVLNPDRIVTDTPGEELMVKNLRFDHPPQAHDMQEMHFKNGEFLAEVEACNGCGVCRSMEQSARMCPVFKATGLESATCRGKANMLRNLANGVIPAMMKWDEAMRNVVDHCIGCRMCEVECPSGVNMARLMAEAKAQFARRCGLRWVETVLSQGETMGKLGSTLGPLANAALKLPGARAMMELFTGVDRRRPMPPFASGGAIRRLRALAAERKPAQPAGKVAYFVDLFGNYHDHELSRAVVEVLCHNGYEVIVPDQKSAALPMISYGDLDGAREIIRYNVEQLLPLVRQGLKIVCSEPSAAMCLKKEWMEIVHTPSVAEIASAIVELDDFLLTLKAQGSLKTDFQPVDMEFAYHAPCHLRTLHHRTAMELVTLIPGLRVRALKNSCCGIAGTAGFKKKQFDLSQAIGSAMLNDFKDGTTPNGLTECATCRMQMELFGGKPTYHPAKILAAAYGLCEIKGITQTAGA